MTDRETDDATPNERATVLVVEDEAAMARLYERWLGDAHDVLVAHTGDAALELLDDGVDVVLLDRRLPGTSGRDVLAAIREDRAGCQVAMVTAVEPDADVLEMGFDDYVTKPTSRAELRAVVADLLVRRQYGDRVQRYFRLLSKRAALEREHGDLDDYPAYAGLLDDIAAVEAELDALVDEFTTRDFHAQFHAVTADD